MKYDKLQKEYIDWCVSEHESKGVFPTTSECGDWWINKLKEREERIGKAIEHSKSIHSDEKWNDGMSHALLILKSTE